MGARMRTAAASSEIDMLAGWSRRVSPDSIAGQSTGPVAHPTRDPQRPHPPPPGTVGVLVAVAPAVGGARVVGAAPRLALAIDYDVEDVAEVWDGR